MIVVLCCQLEDSAREQIGREREREKERYPILVSQAYYLAVRHGQASQSRLTGGLSIFAMQDAKTACLAQEDRLL
jgi:hypothetical protein